MFTEIAGFELRSPGVVSNCSGESVPQTVVNLRSLSLLLVLLSSLLILMLLLSLLLLLLLLFFVVEPDDATLVINEMKMILKTLTDVITNFDGKIAKQTDLCRERQTSVQCRGAIHEKI